MSRGAFLFGTILSAMVVIRSAWLLLSPFHWDEFHFLALVYDGSRGTIVSPLQTFHSQLFAWIPNLSTSLVPRIGGSPEEAGIVLGRTVMLLCSLVSLVLLFSVAKRLYSPAVSIACCAMYCSLSHVLEHGASFRYDPLVTLGFMLCWWLLTLRRSVLGPWLAGALFVVMVLVSLKALVLVPTLLLLCLSWRYQLPGRVAGRECGWRDAVAVAGGCGLAFLLIALLFAAPILARSPLELGARVAAVGQGFLLSSGPFVRGAVLVESIVENPLQWVAMGVGCYLMVRAMLVGGRDDADRAWMLLPCALLLLVPLIYRNAFSYFMPLLLIAPILLAGLAFEWVELRLPQRSSGIVALFSVVAVGTSWTFYLTQRSNWRSVRQSQEQLLVSVHRLFPHSVSYIDRGGMIASFPQRGIFMSSWVMARYHREGVNKLQSIYEDHPSPLLIVNHEALDIRRSYERTTPTDRPENNGRDSVRPPLFESDWRFLRENFVSYSGAVFVAGRRLAGGALSGVLPIAIGGRYALIEGEALLLEGERWEKGESRELSAGRYFVFADQDDGSSVSERVIRMVPPGGESIEIPGGPLFWR